MDWVRVPPEEQGSVVLGTADMQQAVADADLTMVCYDHQQRDTVLGLMVGQLTDGVLCITGVQILLEANVIAVVKHFLKRLSAHRRVRGVVVFVQEADLPNCCLKNNGIHLLAFRVISIGLCRGRYPTGPVRQTTAML